MLEKLILLLTACVLGFVNTFPPWTHDFHQWRHYSFLVLDEWHPIWDPPSHDVLGDAGIAWKVLITRALWVVGPGVSLFVILRTRTRSERVPGPDTE